MGMVAGLSGELPYLAICWMMIVICTDVHAVRVLERQYSSGTDRCRIPFFYMASSSLYRHDYHQQTTLHGHQYTNQLRV